MMNQIKRLKEGGAAKTFTLFCILSVFSAVFLLSESPAEAEGYLGQGIIPADRLMPYSVSSTDGRMVFSARRGTSTQDLAYNLEIVALQNGIENHFDYGSEIVPASDLYVLNIATATEDVLRDFQPQITFKYPGDNKLRNIYLWDNLSRAFIKIISQKDLKRFSTTVTLKDYGRYVLGLFEEKAAEGRASWYVHPRYRKELMAASTQFSRGAKVKVTNLDNGKSVVVTIKDWGPDPIIHPDRVIDLNKIAFQKIASTRAGVINVRVEAVAEATSTVVKK